LVGLGYLALFGLGTIAGMGLITLTIAVPSTFAARRFGRMQGALRLASGVASVVFGLFLAGHGISAGLFSALPQWTPR
jgi:high-affinity nickel-transport protein